MSRGAGVEGASCQEPHPQRPAPPGSAADAPARAFDALYTAHAPSLLQQAYLLTGSRPFARRVIQRAFHQVWRHWPEVAVDGDPGGWVRAAVYDYALSPWRRWRWGRRLWSHPGNAPRHSRSRPVPEPGTGPDDPLLRALLRLSPAQRRALLLHDGLGIGIPQAAAESEASTMATRGRVARARATVAGYLPELRNVPSAGREEAVRRVLAERTAARPPHAAHPAHAVRAGSERRTRLWTLGVLGLSAVVLGLVALTASTGRA